MWRNLVRGGEFFLRASRANKNTLRVWINACAWNFLFLFSRFYVPKNLAPPGWNPVAAPGCPDCSYSFLALSSTTMCSLNKPLFFKNNIIFNTPGFMKTVPFDAHYLSIPVYTGTENHSKKPGFCSNKSRHCAYIIYSVNPQFFKRDMLAEGTVFRKSIL